MHVKDAIATKQNATL